MNRKLNATIMPIDRNAHLSSVRTHRNFFEQVPGAQVLSDISDVRNNSQGYKVAMKE